MPSPLVVTRVEPHRAEYRGGKLYLEGAVPSRKVADAFKARASEVIGPENVIDNYIIDPAAPEPTDGRVVVAEPFLFKTNSAEINPSYGPLLDLGASVMKLNPKVTMQITGYTDNVGGPEFNVLMSLKRANSVSDAIVRRGIARARLEPKGVGEEYPIASNSTPEGRQANRRIEVVLVGLLA